MVVCAVQTDQTVQFFKLVLGEVLSLKTLDFVGCAFHLGNSTCSATFVAAKNNIRALEFKRM